MAELPTELLMKDHVMAASQIGVQLEQGSLTMLLGAGVSKGMGLPLWWELVKYCCDHLGLDSSNIDSTTSNEELRLKMDSVEKKAGKRNAYHDLVREKLYASAKDDGYLLDQKLLIVLGAMMMNSRRGSVKEILTFNFDDVLERYLSLHGFVHQITTSLPCLQRDVDVTIHHPHGFLASSAKFKASDSDFLVFSQYSYDTRQAGGPNQDDLWKNLTRDLLLRKTGLFVGLSRHDPEWGSLLVQVKNLTNQSRITGFWLLGPSDDTSSESYLRDRNVVPIRLKSYEDYVPFLLSVCQSAAVSS